MQYIRVKVTGTGAADDPIHVPIATYDLVQDLGGGVWIVGVRDEDIPDQVQSSINVNVPRIGNVQVVNSLSAAQLARWQTALDGRYPQRDKRVAPVVQ